MENALITHSTGILFILAANAALWFFLEKRTGWKLFNYVPPLLFIYVLPVIFSNTGLIAPKAPVYGWMGESMLPFFLILLLLDVNVRSTVKVMGRGVFVMLIGTAGVVIGAPIAYFWVRGYLGPEAWKGFGALAGSWIGGTGNMAAVAEGLGTPGKYFGLAVIADNAVYLLWLPLLLQSKNMAKWFHKFTGVTDKHLTDLKSAADDLIVEKGKLQMRHLLYLTAIGFGGAYLAGLVAQSIPALPPVLTHGTYKILLVTTFGLLLSFTPAKKIPGSHELAMALIYLFVARMGAKTVVSGLAGEALPFVIGAYIWICIHGLFILMAARLFRIDVHTAAISSAANIGGAASAPIVAAYHDERLVPVSILMALIGYAVGNYAAFLAAYLCSLVA
ncbi:MAG: hypothetical protein DRP97_05005 [Candidatus Latescibacterota bacterium]|nr:DUF819 family protein [Candidatus Latescibacterota bacterium]OPX23195.1 MAG: hypothetical protein B1H02_05240 [Candidatus Latescibacteria bacterium 4484_107]RKY69748.1 MAG: hypothetical protein DRP97_05005 [Candidatus Latescibacterota bacterium]